MLKKNSICLHTLFIERKNKTSNKVAMLSWNKNSFCTYYLYSYKNVKKNIYKQFQILLHTHYNSSKNYTAILPLQLYTEKTATYINIEGDKKQTKTSMLNQQPFFDLQNLFLKIITNKTEKKNQNTNTFDVLVKFNYDRYFSKEFDLVIPNTKIYSTFNGIQYSNFLRKITNHENKWILEPNKNNIYENTSYNTTSITKNSLNLLHMHRRYLRERYSFMYYN